MSCSSNALTTTTRPAPGRPRRAAGVRVGCLVLDGRDGLSLALGWSGDPAQSAPGGLVRPVHGASCEGRDHGRAGSRVTWWAYRGAGEVAGVAGVVQPPRGGVGPPGSVAAPAGRRRRRPTGDPPPLPHSVSWTGLGWLGGSGVVAALT